MADPGRTPLNLRAAPRGAVVGTLPNGTRVTVVDDATVEGRGWSRVRSTAGPGGWAYSDYLICAPDPAPGRAETGAGPASLDRACRVADPSGTPLNVRAAPYGPVMTTLENGTPVLAGDAAPDDGNWVRLRARGGASLGWAYGRYLDCSGPAGAGKAVGREPGQGSAQLLAALPPPAAVPPNPAVPALPERRVALVIGNGAYRSVAPLENPRRDAGTMAEALRRLGFTTILVREDQGFEGIRRSLRDFSAEAARADWAVVYYAGHGLEVGGVNYLVPVDARLASDRDVQFEAIPLDQVLASVEGARKLQVVILDACRDNPFAAAMKRALGTRSVGQGLARIEPASGSVLVAYAARAGQVASDGAAGRANSPFVTALVKNLATPGIEIRKLFGRIRDDVLAETGGRQEPAIYGSLGGDDYFFQAP
ncbi:hypothetical protein MPOCJGCO_1275 [Methylobacterium trifolii]|uniref:Caspase family p20 domain-containing protein n=1 Tax=Methylobacterium trifolii TaxID=1003092 RepID=A0ABQ4TWW9_9HYPH|nr:hypothetical protein MPOCJGCO_1275 [Methylobacterium trifolii]